MDIVQYLEGMSKTKRQRKAQFALCLSSDLHFLLLSDTGTLILGFSYSDSNLYHWFFDFSGLLRIHSIQGIKGLVFSGMYLNIKIEKIGENKNR